MLVLRFCISFIIYMPPRKKDVKKVSFSENNEVFQFSETDQEHSRVHTETQPTIPETLEPEITNIKPKLEDDKITHVVVQLPISAEHVENILSQDDMCDALEYNPNISEPSAYTPVNFFSSKHDEVELESNKQTNLHVEQISEKESKDTHSHCKNALCFWCCHPVEHHQFGMPIRYDAVHQNFTFFGTFCSLECVSAYNFSVHLGSDRAWDIQSWIQMMARIYGIEGHIRPAPSRYTLQMFQGNLTIEEFRKAHKSLAKSVVINIPPLVSIKPQIESMNTSFFATDTMKETSEGDVIKKTTLRRKSSMEQKKTLESKLNLSYNFVSNHETIT